MTLSYDRYCTEIIAQAELLHGHLAAADLATDVPSCPGWNVGQLGRHLGGAHRQSETMVRTRQPADDGFRDPTRFTETDPEWLGEWIVAGATQLAAALRDAGPGAAMPAPIEGDTSTFTTTFTARRMAHETVLHRADAALALRREYALDPVVAFDAIDERLELGSLPQLFEWNPSLREVLGAGRILQFGATDVPGDWVVDLTGDLIAWRHGTETAAVTVRGPVTDLLLGMYKRRPMHALHVSGDVELLDFWLDRVSFG